MSSILRGLTFPAAAPVHSFFPSLAAQARRSPGTTPSRIPDQGCGRSLNAQATIADVQKQARRVAGPFLRSVRSAMFQSDFNVANRLATSRIARLLGSISFKLRQQVPRSAGSLAVWHSPITNTPTNTPKKVPAMTPIASQPIALPCCCTARPRRDSCSQLDHRVDLRYKSFAT